MPDDIDLLRNLAEDVPDMAPSVREQLRSLATTLEHGAKVGTMRCARCGEKVDIVIHSAQVRL